LLGRQLSGIPLCLVPIAAQDPLAFGSKFRAFPDPPGELFRAGGVIQLHVVELRPSAHEMQVSVIEAWEQQPASGINGARCRPVPRLDVGVGADGHNAVTNYGHSLCRGQRLVASPDLRVADDKVSGWLGLGLRDLEAANNEK